MSDAAGFGLLALCASMFAVMLFACRQDRPRKEAEQRARKFLTELALACAISAVRSKRAFRSDGLPQR